jgi:hypothetical protein
MDRLPRFDSLGLRRLTYVSWLALVVQPPILQIAHGAELAILIPPWIVIAVHGAYYFSVLNSGFGFSPGALSALGALLAGLGGAAYYFAGWQAGVSVFLCLSLFIPYALCATLSAQRMLNWGRVRTALHFALIVALPPLLFAQLYLWLPAVFSGDYTWAIPGALAALACFFTWAVVLGRVRKRARALRLLSQRTPAC